MTALLHILCSWSLAHVAYADGLYPTRSVSNVVGKIETGVQDVVQFSQDALTPETKTIIKSIGNLLEGFEKAVINLKKGIIEGVEEVFGIPATTDDVNFFLATSRNMANPTRLNIQNASDLIGNNGKIIFLIHGWKSSRESDWYSDLTRNLLNRKPDAQIVQVDWSGTADGSYPLSAFKTESVGNIVGKFLIQLVTKYHISRERFILIGHSLGGHVSGWVGKYFKETIGYKLPRIIALDPAGPLFSLRPDSRRLNKHDAIVVMVIHTNGGILGLLERCGTIDFYPNGGLRQPGCLKINSKDKSSLFNPLSCSHARAHAYMIEAAGSIGTFRARKCSSYKNFLRGCKGEEALMGDLDEDSEGSFYLKTLRKSPFSIALKERSFSTEITSTDSNSQKE